MTGEPRHISEILREALAQVLPEVIAEIGALKVASDGVELVRADRVMDELEQRDWPSFRQKCDGVSFPALVTRGRSRKECWLRRDEYESWKRGDFEASDDDRAARRRAIKSTALRPEQRRRLSRD